MKVSDCSFRNIRRRSLLMLGLVVLGFVLFFVVAAEPVGNAVNAPATVMKPEAYGGWVLLPALVAIVLAMTTKQVVPTLFLGVLVGAAMAAPCLPPAESFGDQSFAIRAIRIAVEKYIIGSILDPTSGHGHLKILLFTLLIGFVVAVVETSGGAEAMVRFVAGRSESRRRANCMTWVAGMVVFFDDYANTLIIGPAMRPVYDRLRISRAKLAYLIDSTAAPVASLAIIGTWVGAEVQFIANGINDIPGGAAAYPFLAGVSPMQAFIYSLPYRYYPILTLVFALAVCALGRDFGPMLASEKTALATPPAAPVSDAPAAPTSVAPMNQRSIWLGVGPIAMLIAATLTLLFFSGWYAKAVVDARSGVAGAPAWSTMGLWEQTSLILSNADSYLAMLYGTLFTAVASVLFAVTLGGCSAKDAVEAGIQGMSRMTPAQSILVMAWALSAVSNDLGLGGYVSHWLQTVKFPPHALPLAAFLASALISFATGTSWGTMGILCPVVVPVSAAMLGDLPASDALPLFYASVGSVLSGSVFGDHCSPISDTTVLSSIAAGCPHEEHVATQIPYAFAAAIVSILAGDILGSWLELPWWLALAIGSVAILLVVMLVGKDAEKRFPA